MQTFRVILEEKELGLLERMLPCQRIVEWAEPPED